MPQICIQRDDSFLSTDLFKHSTIRLLQAMHGRHCRPFRSPEPFFQGLDAAYTATTISPLPVTKYMTGCRHVQKSHDVILHIPPSSSSNTTIKLLMIDLTEHHLMIHILLAPIRRSTDPQAYVHNPNISQIYSSLTTVYSSFSMGAIQICRRSSVPEGFMVAKQWFVRVRFPTQQASQHPKR